MTNKTNQIIAIISGYSLSGLYLHTTQSLANIYAMEMFEFSVTVVKTGFVAVVGGFCGVAGKEIFNYAIKRVRSRKKVNVENGIENGIEEN